MIGPYRTPGEVPLLARYARAKPPIWVRVAPWLQIALLSGHIYAVTVAVGLARQVDPVIRIRTVARPAKAVEECQQLCGPDNVAGFTRGHYDGELECRCHDRRRAQP